MAAQSYTFTDGTAIIGTITNVLDSAGNVATFKAPPTWTSSDTTIFSPTVSADGLSCTGTALKDGTVTITITGDGVVNTVTLTVVAGVVASFTVTFAAAPPPPPPAA
jgi:hypothetical protein